MTEPLTTATHDVAAHNPPPLPSSRQAMMERRSSTRISLEIEVGVQTENNFYTGFSADISEGGIFVSTYQMRPVGTTIDVEFELPDGYEIKASGIVRWLREPRDPESEVTPGMGIQFTSLKPADMEAIQTFVAEREPMFYDDE